MQRLTLFLCLLFCLPSTQIFPKNKTDKDDTFSAATFSGLKWRSVGPALTSGRVSDIAVHPQNRHVYYVAAASGGVWKTENNGTNWQPVFDAQGSYSIGCVSIDPNNPFTIWVGTGENNSQRSVSFGDGVYKSLDGGKTWENMGLKDSQHIGKIVIDPRNSDVVYVAAQGPLWNAGGDRGLYKSSDGGKTWNKVLEISANTGVTDIVYDPRNPDVLVAASYQRRRRVWTLIDGGPESAIHKSKDAGKTWRKIEAGLPKKDMGRIGLAISPANPDVLYAIIEAARKAGGFFRSSNRGESWEKMSSYVSGSPQYYQELVPDPQNVDRVYSMDTWMQVTNDGGKSFQKVGEQFKHVDNHAMWVDPTDANYLLAGCDGGVYESYDSGATWNFKANLPITQFYRVSVDNDFPFYNIYGGTQDNFTLGGPSRTTNMQGITNRDWFVTLGGDGFETVIDPQDPNILYSQFQYGGLVRFDKRSGEQIFIRPMPGKGEAPLRWNWDAALLISPHSHMRLYFSAQKVFRSDDRGNTWRAISPDLTRQLDRNKLKIMGKVQRVDAVAKNKSTSVFGNIVSLDESPLQEDLIYIGTDDGLIQITENGGQDWRKVEQFPGVANMPYISDILASQHSAEVVYAAFDAHKDGDFKPYLLKSSNRGKSWVSIAADLPERGTVYTIAEDHVEPNLLFVGTEYGVFFTRDGGKKWVQLNSDMPVIAVRDLAIQKRENDLVAGSFGRGFYVLDDYTPLRHATSENLQQAAQFFPVKKAWMYMQDAPLGLKGKSFLGDSFFTAENPAFGAIFTYHLKDELKTREQVRQEKEDEMVDAGGTPDYPGWDELRAEKREEKPVIQLTITDAAGNIVRRLSGSTKAGFHRLAWDLRFPHSEPVSFEPPSDNPFSEPSSGPLVVPGTYTVSLTKVVDGKETSLAAPQRFETVPLGTATLPTTDRAALLAFQQKTARLQRAVLGAGDAAAEVKMRIKHIKKAIRETTGAKQEWLSTAITLENRLKDLLIKLHGDPVIRAHNEPVPPSIRTRVQTVVSTQWTSSSAPTQTSVNAYEIAANEFSSVLEQLRTLIQVDLLEIEGQIEEAGAPFTPGRLPSWKSE